MTSKRAGDAMISAGCRIFIRKSIISSRPLSVRPSGSFVKQGPIQIKHIGQRGLASQSSNQEDFLVENKHELEALLNTKSNEGPDKCEKEILPEKGQPSIIPWYLRVELPQFPEEQIPKRQRIPELPESPPPILEPLLNQISVNLGLDYLSILDLRKVDPPPSLGANLLMLIATARSVKHLQVSADRLCRWLRTEYKLRPDADGLLGRNELRTRLKRKANRAKLMGRNSENNDDDIRSGWVCVDAGIVDDGQARVQGAVVPKDFIGFGRQAEGARIVIQLLTAEKREEIDLESLWTRVLNQEGSGNSNDDLLKENEAPNKTFNNNNFCRKDVFSTARQIRSFHKSARILSTPENLSGLAYSKSSESFTDISLIQESLMTSLKSGKYNEATYELLKHSFDNPKLQNEGWRLILLEALLKYLKSLPKEEAIIHLGTGYSDCKSTPFLNCYYQTLSLLSFEAQSEIHIEFICHAHNIKHIGYNVLDLDALHKKIVLDGVKISHKSYMQILESIFSCNTPHLITEKAADILSTMHDRGFDILSEEMLVKLQSLAFKNDAFHIQPLARVNQENRSSLGLPSVTMPEVIERLHLLMLNTELTLFSEENRISLLQKYAKRGFWVEFWGIFRMAPWHGMPQGEKIFTLMFALVAEASNQNASRNVLRTWFPEMVRELPNFSTNNEELVEAVKACLLLADPQLHQVTESRSVREGEFVYIWRRCHGEMTSPSSLTHS